MTKDNMRDYLRLINMLQEMDKTQFVGLLEDLDDLKQTAIFFEAFVIYIRKIVSNIHEEVSDLSSELKDKKSEIQDWTEQDDTQRYEDIKAAQDSLK